MANIFFNRHTFLNTLLNNSRRFGTTSSISLLCSLISLALSGSVAGTVLMPMNIVLGARIDRKFRKQYNPIGSASNIIPLFFNDLTLDADNFDPLTLE